MNPIGAHKRKAFPVRAHLNSSNSKLKFRYSPSDGTPNIKEIRTIKKMTINGHLFFLNFTLLLIIYFMKTHNASLRGG
jgi:hypothetical protein